MKVFARVAERGSFGQAADDKKAALKVVDQLFFLGNRSLSIITISGLFVGPSLGTPTKPLTSFDLSAEDDAGVEVTEELFATIATVAGDVEICYQTFGDPGAEPLLLVMGLGGPMTWWDPVFCQMLADRGFFVIRYDNRDTGRSTKVRARVRRTQLVRAFTTGRARQSAAQCAGGCGRRRGGIAGIRPGGRHATRRTFSPGRSDIWHVGPRNGDVRHGTRGGLEPVLPVIGQETLHLCLSLLGLERADRIDQDAVETHLAAGDDSEQHDADSV